MNNLFVDIYDLEENNLNTTLNSSISSIFMKTFGFLLTQDKLLKTKTSSNIFLSINKEKILKQTSSNKKDKTNIVLLNRLKHIFKLNKNITVVFSKKIKEDKKLLEKMKKIFSNLSLDIKYIESCNKLKSLDLTYIERYIIERKITKEKFKLLVVIDDFLDFDQDRFLEYVKRYKCVDILKMPNVSMFDYRRLSEIVESINNEYGSSVQILQKRNLQNYDFCMLFSSNEKEYFKSHYILKNKAYVLDITNLDDDVLSKDYKIYEKNKSYIETIFNRMKKDMTKYYKIDLGKLYN